MKQTKTALLSLLLILTILLSSLAVLPASATEIEGETLETYNSYYVQRGLEWQFDFFQANEYWGWAPDTVTLTGLGSIFQDEHVLVYRAKEVYFAGLSNENATLTVENGRLHYQQSGTANQLNFSNINVTGNNWGTWELSSRWNGGYQKSHVFMFGDMRMLFSGAGIISGLRFNWGGAIPNNPKEQWEKREIVYIDTNGVKNESYLFSHDTDGAPISLDVSSAVKEPMTFVWQMRVNDPLPEEEGYAVGGWHYRYDPCTKKDPVTGAQLYQSDSLDPIWKNADGSNQKNDNGTDKGSPHYNEGNGFPNGKHDESAEATFYINTKKLVDIAGENAPLPGANAVNATSTGNTSIGYQTTSLDMDLYAVRFYSEKLTVEELARNHMADLCKYYRLNMDGLLAVTNEDALKTVYAAFTEDTYGETTPEARQEMQTKLDNEVASVLYGTLISDGEPAAHLLALAKEHGLDLFELSVFPYADRLAIYEAFEGTEEDTKEALQTLFDETCEEILNTVYADYLSFEGTEGGLAEAKTPAAINFQSLALQYDLNLDCLSSLNERVRERLYLAFQDYHALGYYLRPILQKTLVDTVAACQSDYYGENNFDRLLTFEGFQILLQGGTGMRPIYSYDPEVLEDLEEEGYTVSFGILRAIEKNIESFDDVTVTWEDGAPVMGESVSAMQLAYLTGASPEAGGKSLKRGEFTLEYRSTATGSNQAFVAFVVVQRGEEAPSFHYVPALSEHFETPLSIRSLATYCKETLLMTQPGVQGPANGTKGTDISIYIKGDWLCEFRFASSVRTADREAINELFEEYQGVPLPEGEGELTVSVLTSPPEGESGAGFLAEKGSLSFYYDDDTDLSDALEALSEALGEKDGEIHQLF